MAQAQNGLPKTCEYFEAHHCRSCTLLALPYQTQLAKKEAGLRHLLSALEPLTFLPIVPSEATFGSRNKAKLAVGGTTQDPLLGFPDRSGTITSVLKCPLHLQALNDLAAECLKEIQLCRLTPYDVKGRRGELKYLLLRASESTGELMLRVVLRSALQAPQARSLCEALIKRVPHLKVTSLNFQPQPMALVEGEREELLSKEQRIEEHLGKVRLLYSPQSFSQVTSSVAQELYQTAATWLLEAKSRSLLDLFCGVGAFTLFAASHLDRALGVELSPIAIEDARLAAALNGHTHLTFEALDVDAFLLGSKNLQRAYDALVVNPPRRGLSTTTIEAIRAIAPRTVIYSSCNAATLARDLSMLIPEFAVKRVQAFDMFPMTEHFETLVELAKA